MAHFSQLGSQSSCPHVSTQEAPVGLLGSGAGTRPQACSNRGGTYHSDKDSAPLQHRGRLVAAI
eukprot:3338129-Alexandrium_andersonii.AAC.1